MTTKTWYISTISLDQPTTSFRHLFPVYSPLNLRRRLGFVPTYLFSLLIDKINYQLDTTVAGYERWITKPKPTDFKVFGQNEVEYKRTNAGYAWQTQAYIKKKTSQRSRWSTSIDAPSSCGRGGAQPWEKRRVFPQDCVADHTLLLQGRRYPESRDLRWTKYGWFPNSITCYIRRLWNIQQHSTRWGTAPWATGSTAVMEGALAGTSGLLFVCFVLCRLVVWSTERS